jgi:hypothetical protein
VAAFFPAVLYYFTCWVGIHFFAMRTACGLDANELPPWRDTLRASTFFLVPFGFLLAFLILAYTPQYAAFWATVSTLPLAFFTTGWTWDGRSVLGKIERAIKEGGPQVAMIASICACAQIIIAILSHTGLGVKISTTIIDLRVLLPDLSAHWSPRRLSMIAHDGGLHHGGSWPPARSTGAPRLTCSCSTHDPPAITPGRGGLRAAGRRRLDGDGPFTCA